MAQSNAFKWSEKEDSTRGEWCGRYIIHGFLNISTYSDSPAFFGFTVGFATFFRLSVSPLGPPPSFPLCNKTASTTAISLPPVATPTKQKALLTVFTLYLQQTFDNHLSRIANSSKTCFSGMSGSFRLLRLDVVCGIP